MKEPIKLQIEQRTGAHDMHLLATEINASDWDDANEMGDYNADSLAAFHSDPNRILLVAHANGRLVGIASATIQQKPYEQEYWLYVDEVDVVCSGRQQGVGTALMREFLRIAKQRNCVEMWLGTEPDNQPALQLYRSLKPDEVESFVGFTWRIG